MSGGYKLNLEWIPAEYINSNDAVILSDEKKAIKTASGSNSLIRVAGKKLLMKPRYKSKLGWHNRNA